jgi:hypothetical protein
VWIVSMRAVIRVRIIWVEWKVGCGGVIAWLAR